MAWTVVEDGLPEDRQVRHGASGPAEGE